MHDPIRIDISVLQHLSGLQINVRDLVQRRTSLKGGTRLSMPFPKKRPPRSTGPRLWVVSHFGGCMIRFGFNSAYVPGVLNRTGITGTCIETRHEPSLLMRHVAAYRGGLLVVVKHCWCPYQSQDKVGRASRPICYFHVVTPGKLNFTKLSLLKQRASGGNASSSVILELVVVETSSIGQWRGFIQCRTFFLAQQIHLFHFRQVPSELFRLTSNQGLTCPSLLSAHK